MSPKVSHTDDRGAFKELNDDFYKKLTINGESNTKREESFKTSKFRQVISITQE